MKQIPDEPQSPKSTIYLTCQHTISNHSPTVQDIMVGVSVIRAKYSDAKIYEIELEANQERYDEGIESYTLVFQRSIPNPTYDTEMVEYSKQLTEYHQIIEENEREDKERKKAETELLAAKKAHKEQSRNQRLAKREATAAEEMAVEEFRIRWREEQSKQIKETNNE